MDGIALRGNQQVEDLSSRPLHMTLGSATRERLSKIYEQDTKPWSDASVHVQVIKLGMQLVG